MGIERVAISLLTTFISTVLLTIGIIKLAPKIGMVDIPNIRSSHSKPTPRGGGIAIIISILIGLFLLDKEVLYQYKYLFLAISIVTSVGVFDDIISTKPKVKLLVISLATTIIFFNDFYVSSLGEWLGFTFHLGYFSLPFTVFAVVGFTNSLNLVDGLDGLATKISIVILSFFAYLGYLYNDAFIVNLSIITISALIAFLFFKLESS